MIELANDTTYGLAAHVFSENSSRAIRVAHAIEAGSVFVSPVSSSIISMKGWEANVGHIQVNSANTISYAVPFGGYKQSGNGRECGQYALDK